MWAAERDDTHIIAAQHFCGEGGAPVNAYRDEHDNWRWPNCNKVYGAAYDTRMMARDEQAKMHDQATKAMFRRSVPLSHLRSSWRVEE